MNKKVSVLICLIIGCLTVIPVFCGYLYEGERITDWTAIGGTAFGWQLLVAVAQLLTLIGTRGMFRELFGETCPQASFWGMLLYLTCPARIYVMFDEGNVPLTVLGAILPAGVWLIAILRRRCGRIVGGLAAAAGIAVVVYAGTVPLLTAQSAERTAYSVGEWLHLLIYQNGHPGLGYGLAAGLLACAWLGWIQRGRTCSVLGYGFLTVGLVCVLLSLRVLPWGSVSMAALLAQFALCVPAAEGILRIRSSREKWLSEIIPFLTLIACVSQTIYTCNMLLYTRAPLD